MREPKYIDEMKLRREIRALPDYGELWRKAMKCFLDCIDEVPVVDAVEVVRCGECRYREKEQPGMVYCPNIVGGWVGENWFCKAGEKE